MDTRGQNLKKRLLLVPVYLVPVPRSTLIRIILLSILWALWSSDKVVRPNVHHCLSSSLGLVSSASSCEFRVSFPAGAETDVWGSFVPFQARKSCRAHGSEKQENLRKSMLLFCCIFEEIFLRVSCLECGSIAECENGESSPAGRSQYSTSL